MTSLVNSISFHENSVTWLQIAVDSGQSLTVTRVVESPLPFVINFDNLAAGGTAIKIGGHLRSLAETHELSMENVRFLLSSRFGFVKRVTVDDFVPEAEYEALVEQDLGHSLAADTDRFFIYQPEYFRENGSRKEILSVAIRREVVQFFQEIAAEAQMPITELNMNCFSVDEMYRRFFPNLMGQTLLLNFTERGLEYVISDDRNYMDNGFRPYNPAMQTIDQLEDSDILASFAAAMESIQHPGALDTSPFRLSQVFLFGTAFRSNWFESLQDRCELPLRILNPLEVSEWQINSDDPTFENQGAFRYVEPLSNIF